MTHDTPREFVSVPHSLLAVCKDLLDECNTQMPLTGSNFDVDMDLAREQLRLYLTAPAPPVDDDEGEFVSCENCDDKRVPLADAVYSESCNFCPECYEAWKNEFDTCEHSTIPHTDEYGDPCELCTKCSGIVRYPDETAGSDTAALVAGEDALPVPKESLNTDHIGDVTKMIRCEACNGTGDGFGRNARCLSCFGTGTISTCKDSLHVPAAHPSTVTSREQGLEDIAENVETKLLELSMRTETISAKEARRRANSLLAQADRAHQKGDRDDEPSITLPVGIPADAAEIMDIVRARPEFSITKDGQYYVKDRLFPSRKSAEAWMRNYDPCRLEVAQAVMGTYDTRGGGAISPDMNDSITELQDKVWGFLEDLGIGDSYLKRINKIIEEFEMDEACAADERRASGE